MLDANFWNNRYETGQTGWDLGKVSPPLKAYFDQVTDKNLRILIPGCGNAYEAEYLWQIGFRNVFIIDLADAPLQNFHKRVPDFAASNLIHSDFFVHQGEYDIIMEQTFFCAIDPVMRKKYAEKVYSLLSNKGKLVGLMFEDKLNTDQPPFGGERTEYTTYFSPLFEIKTMETCYNSIPPRAGRELFINLIKK